MPSPMYRAMCPSKLCTAFSQQVWNVRRISRKSSGSRRVESALEPTMSQKSTVMFRRWALMPFVANGCSTLGNCGTSRSLRENFYRLDLYSIIRQCISPCPGSPGVPWDSYRLTLSVLRDIEVRFGSIADIRIAHVMSALPPKADMCGANRNVRFGPKACRYTRRILRRQLVDQ